MVEWKEKSQKYFLFCKYILVYPSVEQFCFCLFQIGTKNTWHDKKIQWKYYSETLSCAASIFSLLCVYEIVCVAAANVTAIAAKLIQNNFLITKPLFNANFTLTRKKNLTQTYCVIERFHCTFNIYFWSHLIPIIKTFPSNDRLSNHFT